jgi:predicted nucleic acid-binding protein
LRAPSERGSAKIYMSGPDFLDANVLVYAYDTRYPEKQRIAQNFVRKAIAGEFISSVQALTEFAAILLHKFSPAMTAANLASALDVLSPIRLVSPDSGMVRRAVEARGQYGIHFYDGMIIAAAERGGSAKILSEDFNTGQEYFGIRIVNPF